jgi:hypothetical protein
MTPPAVDPQNPDALPPSWQTPEREELVRKTNQMYIWIGATVIFVVLLCGAILQQINKPGGALDNMQHKEQAK